MLASRTHERVPMDVDLIESFRIPEAAASGVQERQFSETDGAKRKRDWRAEAGPRTRRRVSDEKDSRAIRWMEARIADQAAVVDRIGRLSHQPRSGRLDDFHRLVDIINLRNSATSRVLLGPESSFWEFLRSEGSHVSMLLDRFKDGAFFDARRYEGLLDLEREGVKGSKEEGVVTFYVRVWTTTVDTMRSWWKRLEAAYPATGVEVALALRELRERPDSDICSLFYSGVTLPGNGTDRQAEDAAASQQTLKANFIRINQLPQKAGVVNGVEFRIYSYVLPPHLTHVTGPTSNFEPITPIEEALIFSQGSSSLNSAEGGLTRSWSPSSQLLALRDNCEPFSKILADPNIRNEIQLIAKRPIQDMDDHRTRQVYPIPRRSTPPPPSPLPPSPLPDPSRHLPLSRSLEPKPDLTLVELEEIRAKIRSDVESSFVDQERYHRGQPEDKVGAYVTPVGLKTAIFGASAFEMTADGYAQGGSIFWEIPKSEHLGRSTFWGPDAGNGPRFQRSVSVFAKKLDADQLDASHPGNVSLEAVSQLGSYFNMWPLTLVRDELEIAMLFSLRQLLVKDASSVTVHSSILHQLITNNYLCRVLSEAASNEELDKFFGRFDSSSISELISQDAATIHNLKDSRHYTRQVGNPYLFQLLPNRDDFRMGLSNFDFGYSDYDPSLGVLVSEVCAVVKLISEDMEFLLGIIRPMRTLHAMEKTLSVLKTVLARRGRTTALELVRSRLVDAQESLGRLRMKGVTDRSVDSRAGALAEGDMEMGFAEAQVKARSELAEGQRVRMSVKTQLFNTGLETACGEPRSEERRAQMSLLLTAYQSARMTSVPTSPYVTGGVPHPAGAEPGSAAWNRWINDLPTGTILLRSAHGKRLHLETPLPTVAPSPMARGLRKERRSKLAALVASQETGNPAELEKMLRVLGSPMKDERTRRTWIYWTCVDCGFGAGGIEPVSHQCTSSAHPTFTEAIPLFPAQLLALMGFDLSEDYDVPPSDSPVLSSPLPSNITSNSGPSPSALAQILHRTKLNRTLASTHLNGTEVARFPSSTTIFIAHADNAPAPLLHEMSLNACVRSLSPTLELDEGSWWSTQGLRTNALAAVIEGLISSTPNPIVHLRCPCGINQLYIYELNMEGKTHACLLAVRKVDATVRGEEGEGSAGEGSASRGGASDLKSEGTEVATKNSTTKPRRLPSKKISLENAPTYTATLELPPPFLIRVLHSAYTPHDRLWQIKSAEDHALANEEGAGKGKRRGKGKGKGEGKVEMISRESVDLGRFFSWELVDSDSFA